MMRAAHPANPLGMIITLGLLGVAAGAGAGCSTGDDEADPSVCGPENNSYEGQDGGCECEPRTDWVSPDDPFDYRCEPVDVSCRIENNSTYDDSGVCICIEGYLWATEDMDDFRCVPESVDDL